MQKEQSAIKKNIVLEKNNKGAMKSIPNALKIKLSAREKNRVLKKEYRGSHFKMAAIFNHTIFTKNIATIEFLMRF